MQPHAEPFDEILRELVPPGYRLAVGILADPALAEDAVQEAALLAWRRLPSLRDQANLRGWFLAIVANQCRSMRRRRWWSVLRLGHVGEDAGGADTGAEERTVRSIDLDRGLQRLGVQDRLALYLRFYEDMTYEEVARVMGVSMGAARSRIHRATRRLGREVGMDEVLTDV
jgi:RNA polymerase sigma-70 factor (ECF subfamily)